MTLLNAMTLFLIVFLSGTTDLVMRRFCACKWTAVNIKEMNHNFLTLMLLQTHKTLVNFWNTNKDISYETWEFSVTSLKGQVTKS